MNKKILVRQHDITDCAASCLASVCAYHKLYLPVSRIRQYASTDRKGTTVKGLIEAAEKTGMEAKGVKGPFDCLYEIPLPAIAHVIINEECHHFIVIYKMKKDHVLVMDPASGKIEKIHNQKFKRMWSGILVLIMPSASFEPGNKKETVLKRFLRLALPHKLMFSQALFGAVIYSILGLSTAIYVKKIIDHVLTDGNLNLLNLMSIFMVVILLSRIFISFHKNIIVLKTGQIIDANLILNYYKHLMKLPQKFFDTMRIGEITSRISDAVKIRAFINEVSVEIIVNTLILLFSTGLMFIFSWRLSLLILCSIPVFILIYVLFNKLNKKYLRKIMEDGANLESHLVESLNSTLTIKHFGIEDHQDHKTESRFIRLLNSVYSSSKYSITINNVIEFTTGIITILLLWYGSVIVTKNEITPGTLLSFYTLLGYILGPVSSLIAANHSIQDALIAADRLFQIMDLEIEQNNSSRIILNSHDVEDIVFNNVSFKYGSGNYILQDFTLTIEKGRFTAITGNSGSGKTTLVSILQKIYPVSGGNISIGKYDINFIENNSLRKLIGVVPQNIQLFAGTIAENIALGSGQVDMKKIVDICELLCIREFIEKLPYNYNTFIGEHGVSLSGGERQRIAIARAFFRDPEILIFDEATSSLDSSSGKHIRNAIEYMRLKNKTILFITHNLLHVQNADKIVQLEKGMLVKEGKPEAFF